MANHDLNMTLERHAQDYANDPEFIAEGLSIKVIEEMLEYLEQRNLSQSWLAQKTGVSRAHISRILNAPPNMTLLTIAKIAVALGFTPDVCLNAKSRRLSVVVPVTADTMAMIRFDEYYHHEEKHISRPVRQYRQSAAETTEIPVRPLQEVAA